VFSPAYCIVNELSSHVSVTTDDVDVFRGPGSALNLGQHEGRQSVLNIAGQIIKRGSWRLCPQKLRRLLEMCSIQCEK